MSVVWERPEPLLLNKLFNCNPELFLTILLLDIRYNLVPVTRIEFRRIKGRGDGQQKDNYETVLGVFRFFFKPQQREREYDQDTDLPRRESTQISWDGRDGRCEPDSGLGHTQDYRTRYTDNDWTFTQRTEQPAGHKRRAGGRPALQWYTEKCALFTSDGPDSTTSGSDIPEGYADRPPEYSEGLISRRPQDDGGTERLYSPSIDLEKAVIQLQKEVNDCRTVLELARKQTPAVALRPPRRSGFTSTPVPRYSGESNWEQYREVFEAIVISNSWDGVTAALQLLSYLDGDALNVALLVPESRRAFIDIDTTIQLQMVRDRFIDGQVECALRRNLDSLGPNTPMADIVDCCRVWERHREVESTPRMSADRCPARAICQIMEDEPAPAASPETGN